MADEPRQKDGSRNEVKISDPMVRRKSPISYSLTILRIKEISSGYSLLGHIFPEERG